MEEDSSSKVQSCSSSNIMDNSGPIKMVSLPDLVNPKLLHLDQIHSPFDNNPSTESLLQFPFPPIPQQDLTFSPDSQELFFRLGDPYFFDLFGPADTPQLINEPQLPVEEPFLKPVTDCTHNVKVENEEPVNPDTFFDDFPADMFDHVESLGSPSEW